MQNLLNSIISESSKVIVGQRSLIEKMLLGVLTNGHILLEGVPGLAKTLAVNTLAKILDVTFTRIQFTPDMLPSDILGTMIYNHSTHEFDIKKGPIFSNFILADEINRAPSKVQSALLEAMQEKQVTIGDTTYKLPFPFIVMATQNPLEQEGTYPLSEAQTDRFTLKIIVDYPTFEEEREIIRQIHKKEINKILTPNNLSTLQNNINKIYTDPKIETYILNIIFATRYPNKYNLDNIKKHITIGASPRASIAINNCAKATAFLNNRNFVLPTDVIFVAMDILRHRIGLSFEALANSISAENIINEVLNKIDVP